MSRKLDLEAIRPPLTPMIDIAFLVLIFFMCLPFKTLAGKLQAFLPKTSGIHVDSSEPPPRVQIRIRTARDGTHAYRIGDQVLDGIDDVEPVLRQFGIEYDYEVHADPETDWQAVVDLVDVLASLDYENVAFRGVKLPPPSLRRLRRLPPVEQPH